MLFFTYCQCRQLNPNNLMNPVKFFIENPLYAGVAGVAVAILYGIYLFIFRKDKFRLLSIFRRIIFCFILPFIVSTAWLIVTTIWTEYPVGGPLYVHDANGKWYEQTTPYHHKPFGFDGYTVHENTTSFETDVPTTPFKMRSHIDKSNIPMLLSHLGPNHGGGCPCSDGFATRRNDFVGKILTKLVFFEPKDRLKDDAERLKIFREYLGKYGITVDEVTIH